MRSIVCLVALGASACASSIPHRAADPAAPVAPLSYQPLSAIAVPAVAPPLDWRAANEALTGAGDAAHKH